jgi:hypothetical protein
LKENCFASDSSFAYRNCFFLNSKGRSPFGSHLTCLVFQVFVFSLFTFSAISAKNISKPCSVLQLFLQEHLNKVPPTISARIHQSSVLWIDWFYWILSLHDRCALHLRVCSFLVEIEREGKAETASICPVLTRHTFSYTFRSI